VQQFLQSQKSTEKWISKYQHVIRHSRERVANAGIQAPQNPAVALDPRLRVAFAGVTEAISGRTLNVVRASRWLPCSRARLLFEARLLKNTAPQ